MQSLVIGILVGSAPILIGAGFLVAARFKRSRYRELAGTGVEVDGRIVELWSAGKSSRAPRAIVAATNAASSSPVDPIPRVPHFPISGCPDPDQVLEKPS